MSDKNNKSANEEESINENMRPASTSITSLNSYTGSHDNEKRMNNNMCSLATSVVSLHIHAGSPANEQKTDKITEEKPSIIYFLALFYTFLSMGFGTGLVGPSVLKFSEQINVNLDHVVYILFARSFGFLAGTLIGGTLIDHFSSVGRTFLTLATLAMCTTTLAIPFLYHLIPMIIVHLTWSLAAGIVDNLAQILTIRYYERFNVNPYIQALHGAFGVGAFLSPLIIAPFLRKFQPIDQWHYAYWLIGLLHVPNVIWLAIYAIRNEFCVKKTKEIKVETKEFIPEENAPEKEKPKEADNLSLRNTFILGLITFFLALYVGNESGYGAYLHTYATLHLNFNKDIAAYLNSLFWASFAFGRMCGIPLSIPPDALTNDLFGFNWLYCFPIITYDLEQIEISSLDWFGAFGISVASIYPSVIAYTERHISITGKRMSVLAVGGATGDAVIPLLIGSSFNTKWLGSLGFMIICLSGVIFASLLFVFIVLYVKHQPKKTSDNDDRK